jgi:hypothetical protein
MQIFKDTTQCFLLVVLIQQKENTFDLLGNFLSSSLASLMSSLEHISTLGSL